MKRWGGNGFTLLELLVAVALALGMAAAMLSVTGNTLALWRATQGRATSTAQAQLALDLIERDLQAAVFRPEGATTWLAVNIANTPSALARRGWQTAPLMKPAANESLRLLPLAEAGRSATIATARFGLGGAWLRLMSTNIESAASLPVAVAYQIARRPVSGTDVSTANPAEVRYTLFRSAVAADVSFAVGNHVLAPGYASSSETAGVARAASTLANPHTSGDALVPDAVDLGVWLFVREHTGALRRIFPADASDTEHTARDEGSDAARQPDAADVMLRVLTGEGARQIAAMEQGLVARPPGFASDAEWWWDVVERHSRIFVRRVEWKGGLP
ncbi:MAG: hypothetical protein C0502_02185 [Opitutus sp.]|nr:hypothetical protein [Opitutus sp.]